MSQNGKPCLLFYAAKAGDAEQLQVMMQRILLQEHQQAQQGLQSMSVTDHLEYVDGSTGFTPLVAAVHWHRIQAARTLLEHGADVHSHTANIAQTPLRLAVDDVNLDSKMIELLVSYGASPFLEAKDGQTPLDRVVHLRQNRTGPMPDALGSVLLCLRRRCAFRGHLELKVDRYMGLSQTWRKFFCVLAPREKVAGYALDMQLFIFSKNGFDPVTSVLMTDAAPIQLPVKSTHGRACFELALSHRQAKKPSKLFAAGDGRLGYSIYVRALSRDPVEAKWLHRFVDLATTEPNLAMLNGDSEVQMPVKVSSQDQIALAVKQHQDTNGNANKPRSASFSSFSDSAHVPTQYRPQLPADDSSDAHSRSNGFSTTDSVQGSSVRSSPVRSSPVRSSPSRAPPPPLNGLATAPLPVILDNQQKFSVPLASSSFEQAQAALTQQAEQAEPASTSCWRSNDVYDSDKPSNGTSSYRASQSLPSAKSFMSVDKSLTAHWRAKALEGLDDRSSVDSKDSARHRLAAVAEQDPEPQQGTLPVLLQRLEYEHLSQPQASQIPTQQQQQALQQQITALSPLHTAPAQVLISAQQPQRTAEQQQEHPASDQGPVLQSQPLLSNNPMFASVPDATTTPTAVAASRYMGQAPEDPTNGSNHGVAVKGYVGPPASRAIHFASRPSSIKSTPSRYVNERTEVLNTSQHAQQGHLLQSSALQGVPEQQSRHSPAPPAAEDFEELDLAAQHQAVDDLSADLDQLYPLHPVQPSLPSLLIESNLEAVRARSTMLDIPSAELLDSILDFANAVCGEQPNDSMSSSESALPEQTAAPGKAHPWDSSHEIPPHARAAKRQAAPYSTMSRTSVASSVEPFSDDDDVTILDTTEVKKLSPQPLMPLAEGPTPEALPQAASHRQHGQSIDQEGERVSRAPEPVQQPFHHYSLSPQLIESGSAESPGAAARYGHLNRMYDTSTSDLSNPAAHAASQHHSQHSPDKDGYLAPAVAKQPAAQPGSGFQHHSSIYDSSGSQQCPGSNHSPDSPTAEQQHFFDIIEDAGLAPQMRPGEFREMIDGIMAMSEKQAQAQLHTSGGAAALHPIWENEEIGNKQ